MKKISIIILFFLAGKIISQENLYQKIKEQIKKEHPELKLENKLIVVNSWSASDNSSRDNNIQLNKAYVAYEYAKLKGGLKGMIGVSICTDSDKGLEDIVLGKDKVTKALKLNNEESFDLNGMSNVIFDSNGNIVQQNISANLFAEINKLITR